MTLKLLGTGGAIPIPLPGCSCEVCSPARAGVGARRGPSLFVPDAGLLIDTPEDVRFAVDEYGLKEAVNAVTFTHIHGDHTFGIRVVEMLALSYMGGKHGQIELFATPALEEALKADMRILKFYEQKGILAWRRMEDGGAVRVGGVDVTPLPLAQRCFYAYLFEEGGRRALYCPDHLSLLEEWPERLDIAMVECGYELPLRGGRVPPQGARIYRRNQPLSDIVRRARAAGTKRLVFTHIEEIFGFTPERIGELEERYSLKEIEVEFAEDGEVAEV